MMLSRGAGDRGNGVMLSCGAGDHGNGAMLDCGAGDVGAPAEQARGFVGCVGTPRLHPGNCIVPMATEDGNGYKKGDGEGTGTPKTTREGSGAGPAAPSVPPAGPTAPLPYAPWGGTGR